MSDVILQQRSSPQPQPLGPRDAYLWYVFPDRLRDAGLLTRCYTLMSSAERARQERFVFEKERHQFLISRALVRTVLSRHAAVDPRVWRFAANAHGRPEISAPVASAQLRFNLSHTGGLIACIVAKDRDVGVDVEDGWRAGPTVEIAEQYFSRLEGATLRGLPAELQRERFFEYWTLKESYTKARGMGLSLPLDQFSFHLEHGAPIRISFGRGVSDNPQSWQFAHFRPTARHFMAVSIRQPIEVELHVQEASPLLPE